MNSFFSFTYRDPFHSIFVCSTTSLSLFSNCLLIYIIITTASNLGPYRSLLAIFALCDISTSLMHAVLQPFMHLTTSGFYCIPRYAGWLMLFGVSLDNILCMMFIATYYQTFLILSYHLVYRFKTVTSMLRTSFTDGWSTLHWSLFGFVVYVCYIAIFVVVCVLAFFPIDYARVNAPTEIAELYNVDLLNPNAGFTTINTRHKCDESSN